MQLARARDVFGEPLTIGVGEWIEEGQLARRGSQELGEVFGFAQGASTAARDSSEIGFVMCASKPAELAASRKDFCLCAV